VFGANDRVALDRRQPSGFTEKFLYVAPIGESSTDDDDSSSDCETGRGGLSGAIASLVVAVPCVTRQVTGRRVRAFGMNCPRVRGGAGLAPAAGLIRSLSAFSA
jgi:hypothetical protein